MKDIAENMIAAVFKKQRDKEWVDNAIAYKKLLYSDFKKSDVVDFVTDTVNMPSDWKIKDIEDINSRPYYVYFIVVFLSGISRHDIQFEIDMTDDKIVCWYFKGDGVKSVSSMVGL